MNRYEEGTAKLIKNEIADVIPIYYDIPEFGHYIKTKEKNIYFPDFALLSKFTLRKVCWIEVKYTQSIDVEGKDFQWISESKRCNWGLWNKYVRKSKFWYNLNRNKHENYNIIAERSGLPVFLIVFTEDMKYWGRVDIYKPELRNVYYIPTRKITSRNLIPLSDNLKLLTSIITTLVKIDKNQGGQKLRDFIAQVKSFENIQ